MTTPVKPWEGTNLNMNTNFGGNDPVWGGKLSSHGTVESSPASVAASGVRPVVSALGPGSAPPPPIPQRSLQHHPSTNPYMQSYPRYMNGMSSYGFGGYPYNSYGGYSRRMMNNYGLGYPGIGGFQDEYDMTMMQAIDESCRTLFGPFESLVRSISSIAMVLDSTHQAMMFSFRTVLSAADSFSKLKNIIADLASRFSLFKLIRLLYLKILRLLGLINSSKLKEKEWSEAFNAAGASVNRGEPGTQNSSPWLALGLFSIMMGGPYIMFKMFIQSTANSPTAKSLRLGPDCVEAVAAYDFDSASPQELTIRKGDRLQVSRNSANQSWALASNGVATGFVPTNRLVLQVRSKVPKNVLTSPSGQRYKVSLPPTIPNNLPEPQPQEINPTPHSALKPEPSN